MSWRRLRGPLGVAALAALAHAHGLTSPFVFDDRQGILANPSIRSVRNWRWVMMGGRRVITNFSYALDYSLFGPSAIAFHATSLLLHMLNSALVYLLARQVSEDLHEPAPLAAITASLFAVHPLLVESVGYVSSRPSLLCASFLLSGLLAWRAATRGRRWCWIAVAACWAGAALSKETGLLLPLLAAGYDLFIAPDRARARWRALRVHLPLILLVAVAGAARSWSYLHLEGGLGLPQSRSLLIQAAALWRYPLLLAAPVGLSVEHELPLVASGLDPAAWLQVAASLSGLLLLTAWRQAPAVAWGTAWFYLLLAPTVAVPLLQPFAEHRVYEASIGGLLVVAVALARRPRWAVAPVVLFAVMAVARHHVWRSAVSLWSDAVEKAPHAWRAQEELADARREAGQCPLALPHYREAIALLPQGAQAQTNLGICLAELGDLDGAADAFDGVLARSPADPRVHFNVALLERSRGQPEKARQHLLRALAVAPANVGARQLLVDILANDLHAMAEARAACEELEQRSPGACHLQER